MPFVVMWKTGHGNWKLLLHSEIFIGDFPVPFIWDGAGAFNTADQVRKQWGVEARVEEVLPCSLVSEGGVAHFPDGFGN